MPVVTLESADDFAGWRERARRLAQAGVPADGVKWQVRGEACDLLVDEAAPATTAPRDLRVSRRFMDLAELVTCHRDVDRFALLYRLLLRLQDTPKLLDIATDDDVYRLERMARAVRRDIHKMTAFVRFKQVGTDGEPRFLAWFEPDHHIVDRAASFFTNRFATMHWTILTPERSISWDGTALTHGPGGNRNEVPDEDAAEDDWRTYYSNIFNPARLHVDAMRREMPVKYWKNLPEARLIAPLIRSAGEKEAAMIAKAQAEVPTRAAIITRRLAEERERPVEPGENDPLRLLAHEAGQCRRCGLFEHATQTVFGEGLPTADLVFVGEQPGDKEDLAGKPFIGPAGAMFDRALDDAGIDRRRAYVTNAVKHFKFEPRGKRRIHQKPGIGEINACRPWLESEMGVLKPHLTIALGATAIRSLTGKSASVLSSRGQVLASPFAGPVFVTVHPSFLLRLPDEQSQAIEYRRFVDDLKAAREVAARQAESVLAGP